MNFTEILNLFRASEIQVNDAHTPPRIWLDRIQIKKLNKQV